MIINVKVKSNSNKEEIKQINEKYYEVCVKAMPEKGKANLALIKLLAKHFKIPTSSIIIKYGTTSHNKIIEIVN